MYDTSLPLECNKMSSILFYSILNLLKLCMYDQDHKKV